VEQNSSKPMEETSGNKVEQNSSNPMEETSGNKVEQNSSKPMEETTNNKEEQTIPNKEEQISSDRVKQISSNEVEQSNQLEQSNINQCGEKNNFNDLIISCPTILHENTQTRPKLKIGGPNVTKKPFSAIGNRMTEQESVKKIDIKNRDINIENMETSKKAMNTEDNAKDSIVVTQPNEINEPTNITKAVEPVQNEIKTTDANINKYVWPELTIDEINTSFKVVGDLSDGAKVKIINNTYLTKDDSYVPSIMRYYNEQGREKLISFLNHLFCETERNIWAVLKEIRNDCDVDTNVSVLQGIVGKLYVFLHRYENMRNVYKTDTGAFAQLGIIRDKFFTFLFTLFRDMAIIKK